MGAGIINRVEGGVGKLLLIVKRPCLYSVYTLSGNNGSKVAIGINMSCSIRYN